MVSGIDEDRVFRGETSENFLSIRFSKREAGPPSLPSMHWSSIPLRVSRWLRRSARGCAVLPEQQRQAASTASTASATPMAANIYISEGRDVAIISQLAAATKPLSPEVRLGHVFVDEAYNRTGFTLVSSSVGGLVRGAMVLSTLALGVVDLRNHDASHPRLGVVDHVSCHPLARDEPTMGAAQAARDAIGEGLGASGVPTYLYGTGRSVDLASIRRRFGYFKANSLGGQWRGADGTWLEVMRQSPPDFGPETMREEWGIACVGCTPWVVNHNVVLGTADIQFGKWLARKVSERGGGLAGVQAMGLAYEDGQVEVACNLLDAAISGPEDVDRFLVATIEAAGKGDIRIVRSYQTGKPISALLDML